MTSVNVAQSNFAPALRAFGDETVNQPLFFLLIAVLAVSDGLAPEHARIVRFRTVRSLAKVKRPAGRARGTTELTWAIGPHGSGGPLPP